MSAAGLPRTRPSRLVEPIARWPRADLLNVVFSLKSFLGCIAALLVSFELDLERPSWAMLTAYIVAQPYAGMVRSKAAYRVLGTLAGGAFSVLALGTLSSARELLIAALALWLALTVFFTQLDRSARSYSFMLAGYTASIISFPNVDDPGVIFETALARCEEIIVGIVCATVANQLLWPQRAGQALIGRLDLWLNDARRWSADILTRYDAPDAAERRRRDRERLIADALAVGALREHAMFDTPALRDAESWVLELQRRMQGLLAVLVSIEDRIQTLRADRPDLLAMRHPLLQRTAERIAAGPAAVVEPLIAELGSSAPRLSDLATDTAVLIEGTLVARLADLLRYWQGCDDLLGRIRRGERTGHRLARPRRHTDPLTALLAGLSAATAILLSNMFWIATDWPSGSGAVIQAGVLCAIFAGADNPATLAMRFLTGIAIGTALAFLYVLVLLPGIDGLPLLIVVLALFYIPVGLLMADPARAALALPTVVGFTALGGLAQCRDG